MGEHPHASLPDDKVVQMKFEGEFLDITCKANPEYEKFMIYEKGKKLMYVMILKIIYRMLDSALLWYYLFSSKLSDLGLKLNPYERCITNKVIDEHQWTIGWFVDNNRVSHMDDNVKSMIALQD